MTRAMRLVCGRRYISNVTLHPPNIVRSTVSDSMLFHHLDSSWQMEPGPSQNTCWLTFKVDFAFNSVLYNQVADLFFSEASAARGQTMCSFCTSRLAHDAAHLQVVKRMISAFEGRCHHLYGPSSLVRVGAQARNRA